MALSVPLSRSTPRVGGGSAFFVRPHERYGFDTYISEWLVEDAAGVIKVLFCHRTIVSIRVGWNVAIRQLVVCPLDFIWMLFGSTDIIV